MRRIRRAAWFLGLAAATAAGTIIVGPLPALAAESCASSNGNHCYAEAVASLSGNRAVYGQLKSQCLYMPSNSSSASVTTEVWDASSDSKYWVEVGITSGQGSNGYNYRNWFWADSRPGGGYYEHYPNVSSAGGGNYVVEIYRESSSSWGVIGGDGASYLGTSTSQTFSPYYFIAGTEYMAGSTSGIRDVGQIASLEWENSGGTWYYMGSRGYQENFGPGAYIYGGYNSGSSTESWTGPC